MAIFVPIFHFNYQLQNKNCKTNDMFFCYPLKEHINVIHRDPHLYESHAVVFTNTKMTKVKLISFKKNDVTPFFFYTTGNLTVLFEKKCVFFANAINYFAFESVGRKESGNKFID